MGKIPGLIIANFSIENMNILSVAVMDNGKDNITVTTFAANGDVNMSSSEPGAQNKTINGKDGIYMEKDGRAIFLYKV